MKNLTIAFLCIVLVNFSQNCRGSDDVGKSYRLTNNRIRTQYCDVHIAPNLEPNFKFTGKVSIGVYVYSNTDYFNLNSKNLEIKNVKVYSDKSTYSTSYELIPEMEMMKIKVSSFVNAFDSVTIEIDFVGEINDDFKGLYKIQYTENGSNKWLLGTQFQPTYARMVFPCFDEPEYRARFTLSVEVLSDQSVSSLTEQTGLERINDRKIILFGTTMPIPMHVASMVVHKFTATSGGELVPVEIHSREHKTEHSNYFLLEYDKWFTKLEHYFEYYFNDHGTIMIPIPDADDYTSHTGLMILKESDVFHIKEVDTEQHKEEIARVAIHKLSHFWLSVLTTTGWWDNTWLCESSATFLEYEISGQVQPAWKMDEKFLLEVTQTALFEEENVYDTSLSSSVNLPGEILSRKFNSFINKKGASIFGMLQHMVSSQRFKTAFAHTILAAKRQNSVIQPDDLWTQFQKQVDQLERWPKNLQIRTVMNSWMSNSGYPLIKVTTLPEGTIAIEQEEYRSPRSLVKIPDQSWIIPISCTTQSNAQFETAPTIWLTDKQKKPTDMVLKENEWILCNLQQVGYYRVLYSDENWNSLSLQLKTDPNKIHVKSRAQLIDDSFHLAIYEKLNFLTAFNVGTYLKNEEEMLPWVSTIKFATHLLQLYEQTTVAESLKNYFGMLYQHLVQKIGFNRMPKEDYSVIIGRPLILKAACSVGVQNCTQTAAKIYNENLEHLTEIPADQKYVVYCNSFVISGDKDTAWNRLWEIFKNSQIMSERELILKSLACANDEMLLKRYIEMAFKPNVFGLYKREKDLIVKLVGRSFKGVNAVLDTIAEMVPKIENQSKDDLRTLTDMANQISSNVQSAKHLIKLVNIIKQLGNNKTQNNVLLNTMKQSYDQGLKTFEYKNRNADNIKEAIYAVTGYMPVSSTPPPSSPTTNMPTTQLPLDTETPRQRSSRSYSTTTQIPTSSSAANALLYANSLHISLVCGVIFIIVFFANS